MFDKDLHSQMSMQKKTFRMKSRFSKYKLCWHFLCLERKTIGFIFLKKAKWSQFSWRTILYLVFICIICLVMEIRRGNARESLKKHACWKNIAFPSNQKVVLKIQNRQNWPHQFFCIKNLPSVKLPVFAFSGPKMYFLFSRTWQLVVFSTGDRRQIDAVFNIKKNT